MLNHLHPQSPDALLALIKLYAADDRADKIDLGVGVYRNDAGDTPVFGAIKAAEHTLLSEQNSKSYLGPEGDLGFVNALAPYALGGQLAADPCIGGMQTPGGTGAVRLAAAAAKQAGVRQVHMGTPSWPNHAQIFSDLGLEIVPFKHALPDGTPNLDGVLQAIEAAQDGGMVLLHGCCHNPTGIDYDDAQWGKIAEALARYGTLPLIDTAYQGLGRGLEEDAAGVRRVVESVTEALIPYSCDKNFGMYRDRVGALYVKAGSADSLSTVSSNLNALARASWSMPPDHGAATVRLVLSDEARIRQWQDELGTMRQRIATVRRMLGEAGRIGSVDLTSVAKQYGMFAMLSLSKDEIGVLREEHAIYMAGSGRINIAGLNQQKVSIFLAALRAVAG